MMEVSEVNTTNYELIGQFVHYLLTLDSNEYTQFYCETCYERLAIAPEYRPGSPFHEDCGTCSHCKRIDDVSNPHINRFLNENSISLKPNRNLIRVGQFETDETAILVWNWLNPLDYSFKRRSDIHHDEDALFTWVRYGRKREKEVHRTSYLSEASKELLLSFYGLRYRADRFTPDPSEEKPNDLVLMLNEMIDAPKSLLLVQDDQVVKEFIHTSAFERLKAFVANRLFSWKGERT